MWKFFFGLSVLFFAAFLFGPILEIQNSANLSNDSLKLIGVMIGGWLVFLIVATLTSPTETILMLSARTCWYVGPCLLVAALVSGASTVKETGLKSHVILSIGLFLGIGAILTAIGYLWKRGTS